jgi:hypothetical protein
VFRYKFGSRHRVWGLNTRHRGFGVSAPFSKDIKLGVEPVEHAYDQMRLHGSGHCCKVDYFAEEDCHALVLFRLHLHMYMCVHTHRCVCTYTQVCVYIHTGVCVHTHRCM